MRFQLASLDDCSLLAELNYQLICDEGHRNAMTVPQLEERMRVWLSGEYRAAIFDEDRQVVAYALFREEVESIYLRQLFVVRDRRNRGYGRTAVQILRLEVWPKQKRLTVDVLVSNQRAVAFWRSLGYQDYCLTLEVLPDKERQSEYSTFQTGS